MASKSAGLRSRQNSQTGFTIVELMIASAVLSVILLLATLIMTSIGNLYYKGVNQSRTQDDVRAIIDDVSEHLQLSDTTEVQTSATFGGINTHALCVNGVRYTYVTGRQIGTGTGQIQHVLWRDSFTGACAPINLNVATPSTGGVELMEPDGQLADLTVTPNAGQAYNISVAVAFGDSTLQTGSGMNTVCKLGAGDQFCATSSLSVTVEKRLQ